MVPSAVFVNDILLGFNEVTGHTHLHHANAAAPDEKSWVLVNRFSDKLHGGGLQSGDLVVISDPCDPKRNLVRKIVRCGKDWVRVQDGGHEYHVYIKGGYCWVEDHRGGGAGAGGCYDSSTFGPIPQGLILGLPIMVSWPLRRVGIFPLSTTTSGEGESGTPTDP